MYIIWRYAKRLYNIDDIVEGVVRVIDNPAKPDLNWRDTKRISTSTAPYKVYNIGNNNPVKLMDFIKAIENRLGREIEKNMMPIQAGDVPATYADVSDLVEDFRDINQPPPIQEGIGQNFIDLGNLGEGFFWGKNGLRTYPNNPNSFNN